MTTDRNTRNALREVARSLEHVANKLLAPVPPGHVDYISKADAGKWLLRMVEELNGK